MDHDAEHPSLSELQRFTPLKPFSNQQLNLLAGAIKVQQAKPKQVLIELGSDDDHTYFLLQGSVLLTAQDGKRREIAADDISAKMPIALLRPRKYQVQALTPVRYLKIESDYLEDIANHKPATFEQFEGYQVCGDSQSEASGFEDRLSSRLLEDLQADKLELPSLPDVALRIGRALEDGISDAHQISEIIQTDPVITAKLIKAANSALYGRGTPIDTCSAAVVRLGGDVTHKLVLSYALRELFKTSSELLKQRMEALWKHSTHVAALCFALAKQDRRFNPEHAMLVGLLHDIGVVAILNYAKNFPQEILREELIDGTIDNMRAQIGSMILQNWGFGSDFVVAALEADDWMRDHQDEPDYCDLVIIAQLHSYIGQGVMSKHLPAIDEAPAHGRLELGELTPEKSLKILEEAKDLITHAQSMLNL